MHFSNGYGEECDLGSREAQLDAAFVDAVFAMVKADPSFADALEAFWHQHGGDIEPRILDLCRFIYGHLPEGLRTADQRLTIARRSKRLLDGGYSWAITVATDGPVCFSK